MRLPNRVTKILVAKMLLRSMTGKLTDLQRVLSLAHRIGDTGLGDFLEALACDSFTQGGLAQLFLRLDEFFLAQSAALPACRTWSATGASMGRAFENRYRGRASMRRVTS